MNARRFAVSATIIAVCLLAMLSSPVEGQHMYSGLAIPATYRVPGGKLITHHVNPNIPIDYYATLYSDPSSTLMLLVSKSNTDPLSYVTVVAHNFWLAGHSNEYALSNPMYVDGYSEFYIAYAASMNSLAVSLVKWQFSSDYSVNSLQVGNPYSIPLPANLYETGIDIVWTPDGNLWVACITQTNVLNMVLVKFSGASGSIAENMALDYVQDWCVLIAASGNSVYEWVYGDNFPTEVGRLYDSSGTLIYSPTVVATRSSMITLENGTLAIAYSTWGTPAAIRLITFNPPSSYADVLVTNYWSYGISLYSMTGNYVGFIFTTSSGVFSMYYAQTYYGGWGWSAPQIMANDPSDAYAAQVYTDPSADLIVANGHPAVWVFFNYASTPFVSYYRLLSIDLFNVHYQSETTTTVYGTTFSVNVFTTTGWSTVMEHTVNMGPTVTVTVSQLQTAAFLYTLAILLGFVILPALLIGFLSKSMIGFSAGAMLGAMGARFIGEMPDWILVVIILITIETVVLSRRTPTTGGGGVETEG